MMIMGMNGKMSEYCTSEDCEVCRPLKTIAHLRQQNEELRKLLKEQLKISGKCCYAKAPAYSKVREKLIELGYGPDIITETIGEDL